MIEQAKLRSARTHRAPVADAPEWWVVAKPSLPPARDWQYLEGLREDARKRREAQMRAAEARAGWGWENKDRLIRVFARS